MNKSIDNILSQVYELEGLLLLVENHGQNTNSFVLELIRQKAKKIAELSLLVETGAPTTPSSLYTQNADNAPAKEDIASIANENSDKSASENRNFDINTTYEMLGSDTAIDTDEDDINVEEVIDCDDSNGELFEQNRDEDKSSTNNPTQDKLNGGKSFIGFGDSTETSSSVIVNEEDEEDEEFNIEDYNQEDEFIEEPEVIPHSILDSEAAESTSKNEEQEDEDNVEISDFEEEEEIIEEEDEEEEELEEEFFEEEEEEFLDDEDDEENEILTVEEVLSRSLSKNLKQAFTLNDRFRYRRELFGNSDVEMTNTLNLVETMDSYAEAEDYFYGDKEWDKESDEVIDFMTIIRNHFS